MRRGFFCCLFICLGLSTALFGQSGASERGKVTGGMFLGGGGIRNFNAGTGDLALHFGADLGVTLTPRLEAIAGVGFVANVGDNDAFKDRSLLATPGLRYSWGQSSGYRPFVEGGYALSQGGGKTDHLGFLGAGATNWYGDLIGLRFEVRDYLNGDLNFVEGRVSVVLR